MLEKSDFLVHSSFTDSAFEFGTNSHTGPGQHDLLEGCQKNWFGKKKCKLLSSQVVAFQNHTL